MQCLPNQASHYRLCTHTAYVTHIRMLPIISIPYDMHHLHKISKPKLSYVLFIITTEITLNTICIVCNYLIFYIIKWQFTIIRSCWTLGEMKVTHKMCPLQCSTQYQQHRKVLQYVCVYVYIKAH